jgi:phosphonoacetaldehyde hydrolase
MNQAEFLKAIVLDWAGTTVDHGSRAPAIVFQEIFQQNGITITEKQAREPMGRAKRDHIASIAAMPDVASAWCTRHGRKLDELDIDKMYADFLPLQKKTLHHYCNVIEGVPSAIRSMQEMGLRIGSTTGYTRELMEVVTAKAQTQGYRPEIVLCAEDAPRGRPAPYLLFEAAKRLDIYPMWSIVIVDDTPVGIQAGRNAGCWTIGVSRTGNLLGLSAEEIANLEQSVVDELCAEAAKTLRNAGAHAVVQSVADIVPLVSEFDSQAAQGIRPI